MFGSEDIFPPNDLTSFHPLELIKTQLLVGHKLTYDLNKLLQ